MTAFTSGKFRIDDWETLLNLGFTRSGNYFYFRDTHRSCCEVYQYRVDINKFKPSQSQKKVMKRFYKYLLDGQKQKYEEGNGYDNEEEKKESDIGKDWVEIPSVSKSRPPEVKKVEGPIEELLEIIKYVVEAIIGEQREELFSKIRVYVHKTLKSCLSTNLPLILSSSKSGITSI